MRITSFFLSFFFIVSSHAFKLSPMVAEFSLDGQGKTQTFYLENPSEKKVAVQVELFARSMDEDGKETRVATELFSVYPPQVILKPKQKRAVRVTWLGDKSFTVEKAFRLVAEELPVTLEKKKVDSRTSLNFLLKYVASVYVKPTGAKSKVEVVKAERVKDKLSLILKNSGGAHQVLSGLQVVLVGKEKEVPLPAEASEFFAAENILPGGRLKFLLPWPKVAVPQPFNVELKFQAANSL